MSERIESIFHEARLIASPEERERFLDRACDGDEALRGKIDSLLRADVDAGAFLQTGDRRPGVGEPGEVGLGASGETVIQNEPRQRVGGFERPGDQIGRYKLLELIGEGGFGSVWMAEQREPVRRRVALKVIKLGMDTKQVIARFEAERQALAMMDHPNIARVLDAGSTESGRPYFVMELVRGVPLIEYCEKERFEPRGRLELFIKVCHAIQHAHQKGIIHRDIKPSNVLVTMHDGVPVPKVIDFGIAKATNSELTQRTLFTEHRQIIGTPAYMSPEQAEMSGLDIDTRSDIYSLGVLLYEMLTGTTPFSSDELASKGFVEMMRIIREVEPPRPSTRLSTLNRSASIAADEKRVGDPKRVGTLVRGDIDWIVMRCLEKDRRRRYETASALAADIERHLNDQPVLAGPPSTGYRLGKFIKRNRAGVLAGGAIAALLVLGVIGTTWGMLWAFDEKGRADASAQLATEAARSETEQRALAEANERRAREEAARAIAAEERATLRAAELQSVADFQAAQLSGIDPPRMGVTIRERVLAGARERDREALEAALAGVNFVNVAMGVLESEIFGNTIDAIEVEFTEQPLVQAKLFQTIATVTRDLGLLNIAREPQDSAVSLFREHLGDDAEQTLLSLAQQSELLLYLGSYSDAEAIDRGLLERLSETVGEEHRETLNATLNLARSLRSQGLLEEAEPLYERVLEVRRRVLGVDHPETLTAMNSLGTLYENLGRVEEAIALYEENIERRLAKPGPPNHAVYSTMSNLANALESLGRYEEAIEYERKAIAGFTSHFGDAHPETLVSKSNLAGILLAVDQFEEAERILGPAVRDARRVLGDDHPNTLGLLNATANLYSRLDRLELAEEYSRRVFESCERIFGEDHRNTTIVLNNHATILMEMGRLEEAVPLMDELVERSARAYGEEHWMHGVFLVSRSDAQLAAERFAEAVESAMAADRLFVQEFGEDHHRAVSSATLLARIHEVWNEAEPSDELATAAVHWQGVSERRRDSDPAVD